MPAANTYSAPSTAGGNREDLRDVLTILAPEQTPVLSSSTKGPAPQATFVEWMVDTLRDARLASVPEGNDVSSFNNKALKRRRIGNYIEIIRDEYAVTDLQQLVNTAAVDDEFAYAKMKCIREMKRDMELIICSGQDRQAGDGDTPFLTRGLFDWIDSAGPSDVPTDFRTPAASITATGAALTETEVQDVLDSLFNVHGEPKTYSYVCGTGICQAFDLFTRVNSSSTNVRYQVTEMASSKTITLSVKRFESTFGTLNIIPDVFLNPTAGTVNTNAALILDPELIEIQFLDELHSMELEDQGGGDRGYCKAVFAVCCKNPKGLGKHS